MPVSSRNGKTTVRDAFIDIPRIKANSKEEALEKAKGVIPFENNVPHYSETKVIGIDQEWSE